MRGGPLPLKAQIEADPWAALPAAAPAAWCTVHVAKGTLPHSTGSAARGYYEVIAVGPGGLSRAFLGSATPLGGYPSGPAVP
jgi:hypothetical protein